MTKDQLLDAVWQHRFVSESVLKVCINELRRTLDDSAKTPRYIETVARRGYRFIGAPKRLENVEAAPPRSLPLTAPIGGVLRATDPASCLLERAEPLAQLERLLERALAGEWQVVFITGEAGIGKTTVVETFLEPMANRGVGVLPGRCIEHYGAGEAFLPLLEVFDRCCRATGGSGLIARLQRFAPTWLAQMPGLLGAQEHQDLQREVVGATKERMLRELVGALEALSQEMPLVLVLVCLITSSARKYSSWFGRMLSKPLAHFLIGPSPFKWMGIELISISKVQTPAFQAGRFHLQP